MFWQIHYFWAYLQGTEDEFSRVLARFRKEHECSNLSFEGSYRYKQPDAQEIEISNYVLDCWKEVSSALGIDISEERADQ